MVTRILIDSKLLYGELSWGQRRCWQRRGHVAPRCAAARRTMQGWAPAALADPCPTELGLRCCFPSCCAGEPTWQSWGVPCPTRSWRWDVGDMAVLCTGPWTSAVTSAMSWWPSLRVERERILPLPWALSALNELAIPWFRCQCRCPRAATCRRFACRPVTSCSLLWVVLQVREERRSQRRTLRST